MVAIHRAPKQIHGKRGEICFDQEKAAVYVLIRQCSRQMMVIGNVELVVRPLNGRDGAGGQKVPQPVSVERCQMVSLFNHLGKSNGNLGRVQPVDLDLVQLTHLKIAACLTATRAAAGPVPPDPTKGKGWRRPSGARTRRMHKHLSQHCCWPQQSRCRTTQVALW